jgi:hypothetical protein
MYMYNTTILNIKIICRSVWEFLDCQASTISPEATDDSPSLVTIFQHDDFS